MFAYVHSQQVDCSVAQKCLVRSVIGLLASKVPDVKPISGGSDSDISKDIQTHFFHLFGQEPWLCRCYKPITITTPAHTVTSNKHVFTQVSVLASRYISVTVTESSPCHSNYVTSIQGLWKVYSMCTVNQIFVRINIMCVRSLHPTQ